MQLKFTRVLAVRVDRTPLLAAPGGMAGSPGVAEEERFQQCGRVHAMKEKQIPFNWPYMTGKELYYIAEAHFNGRLAGDGPFTKRCHGWLEEMHGSRKALLTHSCTAALEMAALLLDIRPGDEVILPSFTFVFTANAFVLRGGVPVSVDIREDTLNLDERLIEAAVTPLHCALWSPSTTPAWLAKWTPSCRSPGGMA